MDFDYDNDPFADDNDDLCYAEILIPSEGNTPQQQVSPAHPTVGQAQPAHRHADPYAYSTPPSASVDPQRGVDDSREEEALQRQQKQRQYAASSQRVPSRSASVRGSVAAADPDEIAVAYDDMLQTLRQEVSRLQEENSSLYSSQSKLESQLRKTTLEKEDAVWRLEQAQERNALLEERISAMEQDLAYAQEERREQRQLETRRTRADAQAETPVSGPPATRAAPPAKAPPQAAELATKVLTEPAEQASQPRARAKPAPPPFATTSETSAAPPTASAKRSLAQTANLTEKQKEQEYQSSIKSVEKMEAELLEHCQRRDELMGTIQRLESSRIRTIADRAKKAAAEKDLEEEDRVIGHIRLQLRSQSSLHK